jgi:peptidoglycan L-alanyl-D-glutamate endopeptidase CwlK
MYEAKERSEIDFDISCGNRAIAEQQELFKAGRSQLDGVNHKSKHNHYPALAVDIYAYNGKYADYSDDKMSYLAKVIKSAAEALGVKIEWGGDWTDFKDQPHYELV